MILCSVLSPAVVVFPGVTITFSPTAKVCTVLGEVPHGLNLLLCLFTRMCNVVIVNEEHMDLLRFTRSRNHRFPIQIIQCIEMLGGEGAFCQRVN